MRYEKKNKLGWWLLLAFLMLLMAVSCTKAVIESVPDKSGVNVYLDWDVTEVPAGVKFYFYPATGETLGLIQVETSATGYQGELAVGRYQVLTSNTEASGVIFSGMESYYTATVTASSVATRSDGMTLIAQPSSLHVGTMEALEVKLFESVEKRIMPRMLTKTLKLKFDTEKLPGVNSLEGELRGLYASVLLATGEATEVARAEAPRVGTPYRTSVTSEKAVVSISYFGILSPENGASYKNEMPITLKGSDGWEQKTTVDLSQVLTDIASKEEEGDLEFEIEDKIEIEVKPTLVGLSARVVSWGRSGEGEGEFSYITYY